MATPQQHFFSQGNNIINDKSNVAIMPIMPRKKLLIIVPVIVIIIVTAINGNAWE